jgi:3-dehydroquinate synthase
MIVAVSLSENRGFLDDEMSSRTQMTLKRFIRGKVNLPNAQDAWEIMKNDKKNRSGRIGFVLLEGLGSPVFVEDVQPDELTQAIHVVRGLLNG